VALGLLSAQICQDDQVFLPCQVIRGILVNLSHRVLLLYLAIHLYQVYLGYQVTLVYRDILSVHQYLVHRDLPLSLEIREDQLYPVLLAILAHL